ncbi:hypothetical protein HCY66_06990 [Acinetobacter radioresistens]|uniref:hypothetical protein n=1 Tax=Acinetobacter radioresistens TaxID=40216 RepID=UPI002006A177|nr:hypothetical protein [Acinetobacter radioresistens]MCK4089828.1 hypothetical protein [Acinetobacter radioresistens]
MNLIEQLGYEYAKEIYLSNLEDFSGNASGATISTEKLRFTHEELEKALLEYRRQHNIFEVGDWVGIKDDSTTWIDKIVSIEIKSVFNSQWNKENVEILIFEDGTKLGSGWAIHATDAEIEAGKRLEVV